MTGVCRELEERSVRNEGGVDSTHPTGGAWVWVMSNCTLFTGVLRGKQIPGEQEQKERLGKR